MMKIEEAVFELKQIRDVYANMQKEYESCVEALDTAINALEAQESCNKLATDLQPCKQDADDTISRKAAIEVLHDEIVRRRISEDTNDDGTLDEFDTEAILRRLPSAQPEPQWIPCSERLPEEDVRVLISYRYKEGEGDTSHTYIDSTTYGQRYFGGNKVGNYKHWRAPFRYFESNYEVIAWMPLPEPYREGNDEGV